MRIARREVHLFGGPLAAPVGRADRRWDTRRGVLLRLVDAEGRAGQGEASPLEGHSPETFDQVVDALLGATWLQGATLELGGDLGALADLSERLPPHLPSARFALETALLDLVGQARGRPLAALLGPQAGVPLEGAAPLHAAESKARRLEVAALLHAFEPHQAVTEVAALLEAGVGAVKVKIGRPGAMERELALLAALRRAFGPRLVLRADANRGLDPEALPAALERLAALELELLEEPAPPAALEALTTTPLPLALDESLAEQGGAATAARLMERGLVRALVLKPALLGGLGAASAFARLARDHGAAAIASHLFDGPVALAAAAAFARTLPPDSPAQGLAPHGGLAAWPAVAIPGLSARGIESSLRPGLGLPLLAGRVLE